MSTSRRTAETCHRQRVATASVLGLVAALALRIAAPDTALSPPRDDKRAGPVTATITRDGDFESQLVHGDDAGTTERTGVRLTSRVFTVGPSRSMP
jgi:hypothetical protein